MSPKALFELIYSIIKRTNIGAGAKIIGNVKIGANSKIGVNAVVVHDVPEDSIVTAQEGTIVTK